MGGEVRSGCLRLTNHLSSSNISSTMKIQMFVLCDAAIDNQGKMSLLGTFDRIFSKQAPVVHRSCAVATIIRFDRIEEGTHTIKCTFCNEDGKLVMPALEGNVTISFQSGTNTMSHNMILNIQGLKLESYGEYSIDLAVDGRHEASIPLYVFPLPESSTEQDQSEPTLD